jgi:hypothetical protein
MARKKMRYAAARGSLRMPFTIFSTEKGDHDE